MNADLNHEIRDRLSRNKKRRNRRRLLLVLSLMAVLVTSTILASPATALTEDTSGEVVQNMTESASDASPVASLTNEDPSAGAAQDQSDAQDSVQADNLSAPQDDSQNGTQTVEQSANIDSAKTVEQSANLDGAQTADQNANPDGMQTTGLTTDQNATLENATAEADTADSEEEITEDAGREETASQAELAYEDSRMRITAVRADGNAFPAGMTLSAEAFEDSDYTAAERSLRDLVSQKDTDSTTYSIAGFHALQLAPKNEDGSDAYIDGEVRFTAEFSDGLNDAGYAYKEEQTAGNGSSAQTAGQTGNGIGVLSASRSESGTTITKTTKYETSWRLYTFSGSSLNDITDADDTTLSTDSNGACTKVAFAGKSPEGVVLAQIVRKTVTETVSREEVPMPAISFDEKAATENGSVRVLVDADEGTFEEGTTMSVAAVTNQDVLDRAIRAAGGKGAAAAVDIKFTKKDGTAVEPAKPIRVRMVSDVLDIAEKAHVVHVDNEGSADVVAGKTNGADTVSFESDAFSVYAIVYTVDFTFSGYTYSIKGGSRIMLSALAEQLGLRDTKQDKDFDIADVDDVTFSDSSLVTVAKKDGDWELESRKPFTSTEKLTISMKDGSKYEVGVNDAPAAPQDITNNLTDASIKINGQEVTGNTTWNIKYGNSYDITLKFEENPSSQFPNDDTWMTYKAPAGLKVEDLNTNFDMVVDGKTIKGNKLVVDKATGLIKLQWNTSDSNFQTLTDSNNAYVNVNIKASFGSDVQEVKFSDNVKRNVNVDKTHNASVQKNGWYDPKDGKIHYTVTVTSSGTSKDVTLTDTVNGTALTYDKNVTYKSTKGATATTNTSGNGFTAKIPTMSDGEEVKFTYTATVDYDKLGESGTVQQDETSNGVKITCPEDSKPGDNSATQYVDYISFSSIGKNAESVGDPYKENGKTHRNITWNIKANEERKMHLTYISDSIAKDSQSIMSYSGEGLTIVVTHENGTQETRQVSWTDSSITKTAAGWKYTPPESDGKASYNVTYTTKADVTNLINSRNVSNGAKTDYNSATGNASVEPSGDNQFDASKSVVNYTEDEIRWKITVNVPASGLDRLVVTDTLPSIWDNSVYPNKQYIDSFGEIKSVDGLDDNESYAVDSTSDSSKFTMTFYKDKAGTKPGMNQSAGNRTVTIRFTTKNNKDWLDYSTRNPYWNNLMDHTNKAVVNASGIEKEVSATCTFNPSEQTVKKSGQLKETYQDSSGTTWQILEYNIVLSGAKDDQVLTDTFDTKHLQYFDGVHNQYYTDRSAGVIYGGSAYSQGDPNDNPPRVTVTQTDTGITINTGKLPRQQNGSYYGYYRIHYYLRVKLDEMQQLAVTSGGTAKFSNSVTWGAKGDSADIYYPYPGVSKSCSQNGSVATYTIIVNPSALVMNEGRPMQLMDTFTNQAIDYSTIGIKATDRNGKDRSKEVTYDFNGNTGTFTIPDSTHVVLTYQAKPVGKVGENVHMTNEASMKAYHSSAETWMTIGGSASGGGDIVHLKVLKHAKDHMETKLSGAVFQLFDENEKELKYDMGDKNGKNITFVTGSDGYADIRLSASTEYSLGLEFGKTYKLKEIQAPEGYQVASGYIPFMISKDGSSDPTKNLYANGSIVAVADKKITKVNVMLTKTDAGNTATTLLGAVFNLYGSDYIGSDGEVNASAQAVGQGLTTGENGTVSLGTLTNGTYYLVETTAPDGYMVEKNPIALIVSDASVTVKQGSAQRDSDITTTNTEQTANITVTDSAGYVLPSTGGPGIPEHTWPGALLLLLAGSALTARKLRIPDRRKKGGRPQR